MSKCFIFYVSQHHQNTEKLLKQAIGGEPLAELVPLTDTPLPDLSQYSLIGLASGVYMGEPHAAMLAFLEKHRKDLAGRKVFTILTSGSNQKNYSKNFRALLENCGCSITGSFQCKGFDTNGPWKLIGGIAKGHPDAADISDTAAFIREQIKTVLPSDTR